MSNPSDRVVTDASAIINLNATRFSTEILRALPERLVVVDIVAIELEEGRKLGRQDADMLSELAAAGLVDIETLGDSGEALFERLVVGPAGSTLDDGEAATIAYAVESGLGIVMDDNKARRICREQFSGVDMRCSVEIFRHPAIYAALGSDRLSVAVLNALQIARMRVMPEHIDWVVNLIGDGNAISCPSLPQGSRQAAAARKKPSRAG